MCQNKQTPKPSKTLCARSRCSGTPRSCRVWKCPLYRNKNPKGLTFSSNYCRCHYDIWSRFLNLVRVQTLEGWTFTCSRSSSWNLHSKSKTKRQTPRQTGRQTWLWHRHTHWLSSSCTILNHRNNNTNTDRFLQAENTSVSYVTRNVDKCLN